MGEMRDCPGQEQAIARQARRRQGRDWNRQQERLFKRTHRVGRWRINEDFSGVMVALPKRQIELRKVW